MRALEATDLAALHKASFETPRPWSCEDFAGLLSAPGVFLVTEDGPSFALGRVVLDEVELLTIAVPPNARRQGLGRKVLVAFEDRARALGAAHAFLEVSAVNPVAIALYQSQGWVQAGRRTNYYRTPDGTHVDALILTKALNAT